MYNILKLLFSLVLTTLTVSAQTVKTIQMDAALSLDGIVVADDGTLYGADGWNGSNIYKINLDGSTEIFASGLQGPIDMDFDNDGNLYTTTWRDWGVYKFLPDGTKSKLATVSQGPSGLVLNRTTRDIFVTQFGTRFNRSRHINKVDSSGTVSLFVTDNRLQSPVGIAMDNSENLYPINISDAGLFKVTPNGELTVLATLPKSSAMNNLGHIAFANNKLYITGNSGKHYVYEVTLEGEQRVLAGTGAAGQKDGLALEATFNAPNGIAASATGDTLFITELNNTSLIRMIIFEDGTTSVNDKPESPEGFELHQNYPNPFNPNTRISFNLPVTGHTHLQIYNISGQLVRILVDGITPAGNHEVIFNAETLPSGVYYSKLQSGSLQQISKMILSK